jgi:hypothetical protein
MRVIVVRPHEPVSNEESTRPKKEEPAPPKKDEPRTRGGLALSAGGARTFGVVPLGSSPTMGARLQLAAPLTGIATVGLKGGIDTGTNRGVDAQIWEVGAVLGMGAPWSRDVVGLSIEAGALGARYWDGARNAGDTLGPRLYGLGSVILQVPLEGEVRPFVAGDFGVTERDDSRLSSIVALRGGVVWNAW